MVVVPDGGVEKGGGDCNELCRVGEGGVFAVSRERAGTGMAEMDEDAGGENSCGIGVKSRGVICMETRESSREMGPPSVLV